jgi:hypothetical protein
MSASAKVDISYQQADVGASGPAIREPRVEEPARLQGNRRVAAWRTAVQGRPLPTRGWDR